MRFSKEHAAVFVFEGVQGSEAHLGTYELLLRWFRRTSARVSSRGLGVRSSDVGCWPEAPALGVKVEIAEVDVSEVQFGLALSVKVKAHAFVREGLTHEIVLPFGREEATGGYDLHFVGGRINQEVVVLVESTRTGLVEFGGVLLVE